MKYDAFICSSESDRRPASFWRRALARYRVPQGLNRERTRARLSVVLPDVAGTSTELAESAFLVVLCSRESARDPRVDAEIRAFKRLGHPHDLLALILDGEPNAGDANECFPEALKYDLDADGELDSNTRVEPIAADVRPNKDGRQAALLKIVAGLLGVGFDDLYQREQRRQKRNLAIIMAVSLVLTVILGALAVRAVISERKSLAQLAKTREVNNYIESLFTNVDRPALQKMDPKLMTLILDVSEHKLDDAKTKPAPDVEAQMRQILGQAYLACGIWDKAVANLRRSLDLAEPIVGANSPTVYIGQRDLAEALIGAGKAGEAKALLTPVSGAGLPVVRYQLARALALTGDDDGAERLLEQEIAANPTALEQARQDAAFASSRARLPAPANR